MNRRFLNIAPTMYERYPVQGTTITLEHGRQATVTDTYAKDRPEIWVSSCPLRNITIDDGRNICIIPDEVTGPNNADTVWNQLLVKDVADYQREWSYVWLLHHLPLFNTGMLHPLMLVDITGDNKYYRVFSIRNGNFWEITDEVAALTYKTYNRHHGAIETSAYYAETMLTNLAEKLYGPTRFLTERFKLTTTRDVH